MSTADQVRYAGHNSGCFLPESKKEDVYPLQSELLKEDSLTLEGKWASTNIQASLSVDANSIAELSQLQGGGHNKRQQMNCLKASLHYGKPKRQKLDHFVGNVKLPELKLPPFFSGHSLKEPPTDEQIYNFINKRLEPYIGSDCCFPKTRSFIHVSIPPSNEENIKREDLDISGIEQHIAAGGPAQLKHCSRTKNALTYKSKVDGDYPTIASDKYLTGTGTLPQMHTQHSCKNESAERNASIVCNLKKQNKVTVTSNTYDGLVYSDECGDKVCSTINETMRSILLKYKGNDIATLHYSLTALKELIASLDNVEITDHVDNISEVLLQQYWNGDLGNFRLFASTEYPQIMRNVAATCTKNEGESPVVLTAVSGISFDKETKKNASCTLPQEEYRSNWLNTNSNLGDTDKMCGIAWSLTSTMEQKKGATSTKDVEMLRLDNVKRGTDVPVEVQTRSISVVSKNDTKQPQTQVKAKNGKNTNDSHIMGLDEMALSKMNSPANQVWKKAHSVCSQTVLDVTLCKNKDKDALPHLLKDPRYEEISEDEVTLQQMTPHACIKNTQYEDISDDETLQIKKKSVESICLTEVSKSNDQSTSEYKGKGCGHDQAQMEVTPDEKLIPKMPPSPKTETESKAAQQSSLNDCTSFADDGPKYCSSSKCNDKTHLGCQTSQPSQPVSNYNSFVITDNQLSDSDDDDEWMVFPVSMVDIVFKPEEERGQTEQVVLHFGMPEAAERCDATNSSHNGLQPDIGPAQTPASSQIEVFDTFDSFVKAKREQFGFFRSTPPDELNTDAEPYNAHNRKGSYSEPEESCETEDSCDYSSEFGHNRLTVDRRLLEEIPVHAAVNINISSSEDEGSNTEKGQTRCSRMHKSPKRLTNWTEPKQKVLQSTPIIILSSDTDDESDQKCLDKCKKKKKSSEDNRHFLCNEGADLIKNKLDLEQAEHTSKKQSNDLTQQIVINLDSDTGSTSSMDSSNTRMTAQQVQEQIQQQTNRPTTTKRKVFLKPSKSSKKDCIKMMPSRDRPVSSESDESSSTDLFTKTAMGSYQMNTETKKETDLLADDKKTYSSVSASLSNGHLKLSKDSKFSASRDKTHRQRPPLNNQHPADVTKPEPTTFLSNMESSAPFFSNSPSPPSERFSHARQRSGSYGLFPKSKPSFSVPPQLKRSLSDSNNSKSKRPVAQTSALSSSATTQSFARKQVKRDWNNSFVPTKMDRRHHLGKEKPLRTIDRRNTIPGPPHQSRQMAPRQRHHSSKTATPLMKKTKLEAIQRTKDINRTTSTGQSNVVGKHYKWAEEQRPKKVASNYEKNRH